MRLYAESPLVSMDLGERRAVSLEMLTFTESKERVCPSTRLGEDTDVNELYYLYGFRTNPTV